MNYSYFITATDTGAGKTLVASSIARALRLKGRDVGVMKPVESGCVDKDGTLEPDDALTLKEASSSADSIEDICPYRLALPLSPHLAARLSGVRIDFEVIKSAFRKLSDRHGVMLVEGAGGLLTPLTDELTVADLAATLGLPLVIVAPSRLGVINHTLLTVEAARARGLEVASVILNELPDTDQSTEFNSGEIRRVTGLPVFDLSGEKKEVPCQVAGDLLEFLFG